LRQVSSSWPAGTVSPDLKSIVSTMPSTCEERLAPLMATTLPTELIEVCQGLVCATMVATVCGGLDSVARNLPIMMLLKMPKPKIRKNNSPTASSMIASRSPVLGRRFGGDKSAVRSSSI
jgi:hypothetical protein